MTPARSQQTGAAILAAMLTVTLVATFAASATWQQYRSIEVETAERERVQSAWLSTAALDWARWILLEDAREGGTDHLTEPWAVSFDGLQLAGFLYREQNATLTGQIIDLQSRLNVANLIDENALSAPDLQSFTRLFDLLGLPPSELTAMSSQLLNAMTGESNQDLIPQRTAQLTWLGLSPPTLKKLSPYITLLPARTPVNLNTASAEVIYASTPDLSLSDARKLVALRGANHFRTPADANTKMGGTADYFGDGRHAAASSYFEVHTKLKLRQVWVEESAAIQRGAGSVSVLWRDRGATSNEPAKPRP